MKHPEHHHIVDGISLAYHGSLPDEFVVPTPAAFETGDAQIYGWEWYNRGFQYVSGRPSSHMPKTRKLETFGDIDIEGDQVHGPSYYYGSPDEFGYRNFRNLGSRAELFSLLKDSATVDVKFGYAFGCFNGSWRNYPLPHVSVALIPAQKVKTTIYSRANHRYEPFHIFKPTDSFEDADPTIAHGKWRRYGFAILRQPGVEKEDPGLYSC